MTDTSPSVVEVEKQQVMGASADADRATHEQSPQAGSAVPVGIPSAALIAATMLGQPSRTTYAPKRIEALMSFLEDQPIRATVFMSYKDFRRLRDDGLIEGETHSASLTPLGLGVRRRILAEVWA